MNIEKILSPTQINQIKQITTKENWTVVIPAAGKGSRLNFTLPKILFPINGQPMLSHLVKLLSNYAKEIVIVASPEGRPSIESALKELSLTAKIAIQQTPNGMGDAVLCAEDFVKTKNCIVIWGDQILIKPKTLESCMRLHERKSNSPLTLPTIVKRNPYIHFVRNSENKIEKVLQRREGEISEDLGENDGGLFFFTSKDLFKVLKKEKSDDSYYGKNTKEFNLLQVIPKFEEIGDGIFTARVLSEEETLGINTKEEAEAAERILKTRTNSTEDQVNVVVFSGGRGTATISENLMLHPQVHLTLLINAYDDGLSTGKLRGYIPGMLGPSDVRKNISRLIKETDLSDKSLKFLLEYRLPKNITEENALVVLSSIGKLRSETGLEEVTKNFIQLRLNIAHSLAEATNQFLSYFEVQNKKGIKFDFQDCSLGNIFFAGLYLQYGNSFNQATKQLSEISGVKSTVLNITNGENLVLVGLKEDNTFLEDEAEIVSKQSESRVSEIYLLDGYLTASEKDNLKTLSFEMKNKFLREKSKKVSLNELAKNELLNADIVIYGPGTQHSSLFPSYLTEDVCEAIAANTHAEKIFIANIHRDHDLQGETMNSLVNKLKFYLSRKGQVQVEWKNVLSSIFFQQMDTQNSTESHLDLDLIDLEKITNANILVSNFMDPSGSHSGSRVMLEIMSIIGQKMQRKIRSNHTSVSIIVPSLNEEKTIKSVLQDLMLLDFSKNNMTKEVILIDGGSTDQTVELAKSVKGVRILNQEGKRLLRGEAIQKGIKEAQGSIICTFPSDGEYNVKDVEKIVQSISNTEFKTVWGSRAIKCTNLKERIMEIYSNNWALYLISKYGGMILSILSWMKFNRFVSDPLTSIKAFDAAFVKGLVFNSKGVEFEIELIQKVSDSNNYILEIPVEFKARTKKQGKKMNIFDGFRCLKQALFN